jgi:hypothetical protein
MREKDKTCDSMNVEKDANRTAAILLLALQKYAGKCKR